MTWQHSYSGKVRDLYVDPEHPELVLMVASDRVSAFDHVLEPGIPGKGELLTRLSLWWFAQLDDIPNHLVEPDLGGLDHRNGPDLGGLDHRNGPDLGGLDHRNGPDLGGLDHRIPAEFAGRAMLVRRLDMYPVECVVRGYLTGSGWAEYRERGTVCGIALPPGLEDGDRLPEPIFTPAFKAPLGEHDENISFERTVELVGEPVASGLRARSLEIFARASAIAEARGVILADTKFEFGADPGTGELTLGDEVLTSDSSRYWDAAAPRGTSFDKQIVRDWLAANWNGQGTPPRLPAEIVERTAARYRELIQRLTA